VGTFVLARDEATNTGRLSRLIEIEAIEERIPLVFTHNCTERSPDVVPGWVIWFVIEVVVNSLA
jgi:hypothetical protein